MEYQQYMKKIDEKLSSMNDIEIRASFRNFLRQISEDDREQTLVFFKKPVSGNHKKELADFKQWLSQVEEGNICFVYEFYEDYSDGYWNSERYNYEDPQEIGKTLKMWLASAERWLYDRQYKDALEVYRSILPLVFFAEDEDGGDTMELTVRELAVEGLANLDLKRLYGLAVYAAYQGTPVTERAGMIYELIVTDLFSDFSLNHMLAVGGEEILDLKEFLPIWRGYLRTINSAKAGNLLKEAVSMQGKEGLLEEAKLSVNTHPELYVDALQGLIKLAEYEKLFKEGHSAMDAMDPNWVLRAQACRMTAIAAKQLGKSKELVEAAWEAFKSESSVGNLLFLLGFSQNNELLQEKISKKIEALKPEKNIPMIRSYDSSRDKERNTLSENQYHTLRFFLGRFRETFEICSAVKKPLGWSYEFIHTGVPLLFVLLYQGNTFGTGMKALVKNLENDVQYKEEYGNEPFCDALYIWKQSVNLGEDDKEKYYNYLKNIIEKRIDAIVSEKHRGSYWKAALLAACLGELDESRGVLFGKKKIMDYYNQRFIKYSAFRKELKSLV